MAAKKFLEEGKLGRVHLCRVFEQCYEADFRWGPDSEPPETLDWEMWNGPAPARKYNKAIHVRWRKLWDYAGGQMSYQGIHQLDLARWLCGVDYPSSVYCVSRRFTDGDAETPVLEAEGGGAGGAGRRCGDVRRPHGVALPESLEDVEEGVRHVGEVVRIGTEAEVEGDNRDICLVIGDKVPDGRSNKSQYRRIKGVFS